MFTRMGAQAFAERARRELVATGEKVSRQPVGSGAELTAQEAQITRLAGDGLTNQEIGAGDLSVECLLGLFVPVIGVMAAIGLVLYFIGAVVTVVRPRVYSRSAVLLLL